MPEPVGKIKLERLGSWLLRGQICSSNDAQYTDAAGSMLAGYLHDICQETCLESVFDLHIFDSRVMQRTL